MNCWAAVHLRAGCHLAFDVASGQSFCQTLEVFFADEVGGGVCERPNALVSWHCWGLASSYRLKPLSTDLDRPCMGLLYSAAIVVWSEPYAAGRRFLPLERLPNDERKSERARHSNDARARGSGPGVTNHGTGDRITGHSSLEEGNDEITKRERIEQHDEAALQWCAAGVIAQYSWRIIGEVVSQSAAVTPNSRRTHMQRLLSRTRASGELTCRGEITK